MWSVTDRSMWLVLGEWVYLCAGYILHDDVGMFLHHNHQTGVLFKKKIGEVLTQLYIQ